MINKYERRKLVAELHLHLHLQIDGASSRSIESYFFAKKSRSLLVPENRILHFSSRNLRFGFHISLSLLDFTSWYLVNAWVVLSRQLTTRGKPITICKSIPESSSIISDSSLLPCLAQFWKKEKLTKKS